MGESMGLTCTLIDELMKSFSSQFCFFYCFLLRFARILSDCIPINGSRRISYLILSSILSFIPWVLLGVFEAMRMSPICMIGLLTIQNFGTAMADVVIDAMIAEAAREERFSKFLFYLTCSNQRSYQISCVSMFFHVYCYVYIDIMIGIVIEGG